MKKLLCSMLMLFSVFLFGGLFSSTAFAAAVTYENIAIGETGNKLKYTLTADAEASTYTATVCVPKTVSGEITIPATVDYKADGEAESHTYTVTTITKNSSSYDYGNDKVTKITISEGITTICENAFANFSSLNSVSFPATIHTLGLEAFKGCSALESVDLSATSLTRVPHDCFSYCTALSEVTLTTTVTSIADRAFYGCDNLLRVNLTELTSLAIIGSDAFESCSRLRYSSLTDVPESGYEFVLPSSVQYVYNGAFSYTDLRSVDLSAVAQAFTLYGNVFSFSSLETIKLPGSLSTDHDGEMFTMTPKLREIAFANNESNNYKVIDGVLFSKDGATLVYYPAGRPDTEYAVPSGITVIADGAFNSSKLKSITLPDGLVSIGNYAFIYCDLLKTVTLPSSVTSVGSSTFGHCQSLLSLDFSACQELTVDGYCVANSLSLRTVKLPPVIDNISPEALVGCDSVALYWKSDTPIAYLFAGYDSPVVVVSHDVGTVPSLFGAHSVVFYPDTARIAWDVSDPEMSSVLVPYHVENSESTKLPLRISLDIGAFPRSDILMFVKCLHGLKIAGYEVVNGDEILEAGYPFVAYEDLPGGTTSDSLTKKVILTRTTYALKYDGDCVSQFTGETITRPTPSNPEILTLDRVTDDTVTLNISYGQNNPRDYRVRVHDEVLVADSSENEVYTYTVQVKEPITRVYIESPYDVAGAGVFSNTGSGIYVYNRKWRV